MLRFAVDIWGDCNVKHQNKAHNTFHSRCGTDREKDINTLRKTGEIMGFVKTDVKEIHLDPFKSIGDDWMLITAGDERGFNTMTASWGFMGVMWGKNCIEAVIRDSRYTLGFVEANELFTVSFYGEEYRKALQICGSVSGRDCDKAQKAGLTPLFIDGTAAFEEAHTILVCRKLYTQRMDIARLCESEQHWYKDGDPHNAIIGEIVTAYTR